MRRDKSATPRISNQAYSLDRCVPRWAWLPASALMLQLALLIAWARWSNTSGQVAVTVGLVSGLALLLQLAWLWSARSAQGHRGPLAEDPQALRDERIAEAERLARLGHWSWDVATGALHASAEAARIFDLPRGAPVTLQDVMERIEPADQSVVEAALTAAQLGERPYAVEYRLRRRDGSTCFVYEQGHVRRDGAGRPVRVFGTAQDITRHKEDQLALQRMNRFYAVLSGVNKAMLRVRDRQHLFGTVCEIIADTGGLPLAWVAAPDGGRPDRLVPLACAGSAAGYCSGLEISLVDADERAGPVARAFLAGTPQLYQRIESVVAMQPWSGRCERWRLHAIVTAPLRENGRVVAVLAVYGDEPDFFNDDCLRMVGAIGDDIALAMQALSEEERRRAAEADLRQANATLEQRVAERTQALEVANQELRAFSYSISHDLRAPLRAINGFGRILAEQKADLLDGEAQDYLGRILNASARMRRMIDAMLELAHVGAQPLSRCSVDLEKITEAVIAELRSAEPHRYVAVDIEPGLSIQADPDLIRIVMQNLLGNALKFTAGRGSAAIRIGSRVDAGRTVYFVADNGIGFEPEAVDRLFQPFVRLHAQAGFEGNGIGLATVKRIISRHGGRIWAQAEPGKGATFLFTIDVLPHCRRAMVLAEEAVE